MIKISCFTAYASVMTNVASVVAQASANLLKVVTKLLTVKFQSVDRKLTLQVGGVKLRMTRKFRNIHTTYFAD